MTELWQTKPINTSLIGAYAISALAGFAVQTPIALSIAASLAVATSATGWLINLKRYRIISDTPTSNIGSAPLGYVEILGQGFHQDGERLKSYLTGLPCLWYRYIVERLEEKAWKQVESGESDDTFGLRDDTGMILVDPEHAEILVTNKQNWINDNYRYTEWSLIAGDTIYVLGEHAVLSGATAELDFRSDVSMLLSDWKADKPDLLRRFDLDGNGEIDPREWALARRAAQREVEKQHQEIRQQGEIHLMRKQEGRPYLIANKLPEELTTRYEIWAWLHLSLMLAACTVLAFSLTG